MIDVAMLSAFPYNLRRYRQDLRWSQAELARRAGLSQQYLSALERGLLPSDSAHVGTLAAALGVSEADLNRLPRRLPANRR